MGRLVPSPALRPTRIDLPVRQHLLIETLYEREWQDYSFAAVLNQSLILNLEDQARWMVRGEAGSARLGPNFLDFIYTDGLQVVQPDAVRIAGQ